MSPKQFFIFLFDKNYLGGILFPICLDSKFWVKKKHFMMSACPLVKLRGGAELDSEITSNIITL